MQYTFKQSTVPSVALAIVVPIFLALGNWQLHRAEEKRTLMAEREARSHALPVEVQVVGPNLGENRFRLVSVAGDYDAEHQFLLDNQIDHGRAGYHVLTPLRIAGSDATVLVNRGWLPNGPDRTQHPNPPVAASSVRFVGLIERFPQVGMKLKGAEVPTEGWPAIVQVAEADALSARLGYRIYPYQVLLPADHPDGFTRDWHPAALDPEKNQGYALQWFAFAAVSVVIYLWYGFKRKTPR